MRSSVALLAAVLLVFSSAVGVGLGQSADGRTRALDSHPVASTAINGSVHDGTTIHVSLRPNGDAKWNVTTRFVLKNENETAAFRSVAAKYENGTTKAGFTKQTFERVVEHAATDVDRAMKLENVERFGYLRNNGSVGILSISFVWTNFSRTEGERVVIDDVFTTDSGLWLPTLTEDQTLVIEGPGAYYIMGASPSGGTISGNVLRYEGPQQFDVRDLSVTYAPRATSTAPENTTTTTTPTDPGGFPDFSGRSEFLLLALVVGVGAYAWSQRRDANPDPQAQDTDDESPESPPADRFDAEPEAELGEAEAVEEDDETDDEPDVELLSDEERVLRLLRENDGRMKQANIVKETNWSNAKVSQLLSKMDDNGDVDKLRIGRENLISLPDEDVTDVD